MEVARKQLSVQGVEAKCSWFAGRPTTVASSGDAEAGDDGSGGNARNRCYFWGARTKKSAEANKAIPKMAAGLTKAGV